MHNPSNIFRLMEILELIKGVHLNVPDVCITSATVTQPLRSKMGTNSTNDTPIRIEDVVEYLYLAGSQLNLHNINLYVKKDDNLRLAVQRLEDLRRDDAKYANVRRSRPRIGVQEHTSQ
jgi:hypothetical protein